MSGRKRKGSDAERRPKGPGQTAEPEPNLEAKRATQAAAAVALTAPAGAAAAAQGKEEDSQFIGGVRELYKIVASYVPKTVFLYTATTDHRRNSRPLVHRMFQCHKVAHAYAICSILREFYGTKSAPFPVVEVEDDDNYVYVCLRQCEDVVVSRQSTVEQKRAAYALLYKNLIDPLCEPSELERWLRNLSQDWCSSARHFVKELKVASEADVAAELDSFV